MTCTSGAPAAPSSRRAPMARQPITRSQPMPRRKAPSFKSGAIVRCESSQEEEAVARFEAYAAARGVTVTADDGYVPAITDPDHVTTILSNLVSNAIKATPEGGTVTIHTAVDGGDAVIRVSDTGVGIEPQYLPYLFDRLYRVETSRVRDDDSGSGLGLSIVRRLTLLLGGRISVRSTPGEGTEFTVWLLGARMVDV